MGRHNANKFVVPPTKMTVSTAMGMKPTNVSSECWKAVVDNEQKTRHEWIRKWRPELEAEELAITEKVIVADRAKIERKRAEAERAAAHGSHEESSGNSQSTLGPRPHNGLTEQTMYGSYIFDSENAAVDSSENKRNHNSLTMRTHQQQEAEDETNSEFRLIFEGTSKDGKGRKAYLHERLKKDLVERGYTQPMTTSQCIGWRASHLLRLQKRKAEEDMRKFTEGCRTIQLPDIRPSGSSRLIYDTSATADRDADHSTSMLPHFGHKPVIQNGFYRKKLSGGLG